MIMYSKVGKVPINLISTNSFFDTSCKGFLTAMLVGAVLQTTLLDSPRFTQKFTRNPFPLSI